MSLQSRTGTRSVGSCHQPWTLRRKNSDCLGERMSLQQEGGRGSGWGEPGSLCSPYLLVEMLTATPRPVHSPGPQLCLVT